MSRRTGKWSAFEIASKLAHDRAIFGDTRAIPLDDFGPPATSYAAELLNYKPRKRVLTPRKLDPQTECRMRDAEKEAVREAIDRETRRKPTPDELIRA